MLLSTAGIGFLRSPKVQLRIVVTHVLGVLLLNVLHGLVFHQRVVKPRVRALARPVRLAQIVRDVIFQQGMIVDLCVIQSVLQVRVRSDGLVTLAHQAHIPCLLELAQIVVLHFASKKVPEFTNTHLHVSDIVVLQSQPILRCLSASGRAAACQTTPRDNLLLNQEDCSEEWFRRERYRGLNRCAGTSPMD